MMTCDVTSSTVSVVGYEDLEVAVVQLFAEITGTHWYNMNAVILTLHIILTRTI